MAGTIWGGPGADHRDPASRRRPGPVPAGGAHDLAGVPLDAGNVGQRGLDQRADAGDHVLGPDDLAARGDMPEPFGVVPADAGDIAAEPNVGPHPDPAATTFRSDRSSGSAGKVLLQ